MAHSRLSLATAQTKISEFRDIQYPSSQTPHMIALTVFSLQIHQTLIPLIRKGAHPMAAMKNHVKEAVELLELLILLFTCFFFLSCRVWKA